MKRNMWKSVILAAGLALAAPAAVAQTWEGAYVGLYGGGYNSFSGWLVGGNVGYNFSIGGNAYAGAELDLFRTGSGAIVGGVNARLAYEVSPDFLLFGLGGLATQPNGNDWWIAGAGAEYMIMNDISLRAEVDRYDRINGPQNVWVVKAGLAYHF